MTRIKKKENETEKVSITVRIKIMKQIIIFSLLLFISCSPQEENVTVDSETEVVENTDEISVSTQQFQSAGMQLGKIAVHDFYDFITTTGMLQVSPQNQADVSAYYGGYVTSINLLPGQWVNAGQVLFTLENPEFIEAQQDYLEAKSQLDYLRQDYERQRTLAEEEIVSQKKYQRSKADYDLVRTQVDVLRRKLQMMKINPNAVSGKNIRSTIAITAPIGGYVSEIFAVKGQFLSPQDVALSIANTHNMQLELKVFEKDLPKIQREMPVEFRLQENPDSLYQARIHLIGRSIDPQTRTAEVHCKLSSASGNFSDGMYAEAKIKTESVQKKALPKEAVLELDDESMILIKKASENGVTTFEKFTVETGLEDEEFVEILNASAIPANSEILIQGGFQLVQ